jgi:small conductance mechanosensitive channel
MKDSLQSLDQATTIATDLALRYGPNVLAALAILVVGYYAARWSGRSLLRALARAELELPVRSLLGRAAQLLVLGVFALMALQNLGVELLPLVAGLGIVGAGIALAMQGVLGNVVAGLTILFTRPFRVGEYVSIASEEGLVQDITLFSTTLQHADLSRVVIPNRKIVGEIMHNYGRIRQLGIEVGVSHNTDLRAAFETIRDVLRGNPRVLADPAPVVGVAKIADSCVVMSIRPWVQTGDYGPAASEINGAVLDAFRARGIVLPLPQREVRVLAASAYVAAEPKERFAGRDAA